eukprot:scaffold9185_cov107-Skeletonema_marinoi.AAC.4
MCRSGHPEWTSPGHQRGCSMADTTTKELEQWKLSFYAIVADYNGPLQAVDCSIRSVRYDMMLSRACDHPKLGLTRSPTRL